MRKTITLLVITWSSVTFAQNSNQIKNSLKRNNLPIAVIKTKARLANNLQNSLSIGLIDSVKNWTWDTVHHVWNATSKTIHYTYDSQNRNTGNLSQTYSNTTWVNQDLSTTTYTGNMSTTLIKSWNTTNSTWGNSGLITDTYDAHNNLLSNVHQNWNTTNNTWTNAFQYLATVNSANLYTSFLSQIWSNAMWYNYSEQIYIYNSNNVQTSSWDKEWDYNTHAFVDSSLTKTTYTSSSVDSSLTQTWAPTPTITYAPLKASYTLDANNNITHEIDLQWNFSTSTWENFFEYFFTYDANHNQLSQITYGVYNNNNIWVNYSRYYATYDSDNNQLSQVREYWTGDQWAKDSTYYYYSYVTGISNVEGTNEQVNIYPNPATNSLQVLLAGNSINSTIVITDMLGNTVKQVAGINNQVSINVADLAEDVYNILIQNTESRVNKKVVIVR